MRYTRGTGLRFDEKLSLSREGAYLQGDRCVVPFQDATDAA
jgi:hypothetical protein